MKNPLISYFERIESESSEKNRLRLALLKERADYRTFWQESGGDELATINDAVIKSLEAKEVDIHKCRYRDTEPSRFIDCLTRRRNEVAKGYTSEIERIGTFIKGLRSFGILNPERLEDCWDALNPFNDEIPKHLPFRFVDAPPPIWQIRVDKEPGELGYGIPLGRASIIQAQPEDLRGEGSTMLTLESALPLKPSERLLKIDLSRKRSELLNEFKLLLDRVDFLRDRNASDNYEEWEQDSSRFREECWRHLAAWKMARRGKSYTEIAHELNIRADAVKKSIARAYELIEGCKYDKEHFRKIYKSIPAAELEKTCKNCPEKPTCEETEELCPAIIQFINQDYKAQQHLLVGSGSPEMLSPRKKTHGASGTEAICPVCDSELRNNVCPKCNLAIGRLSV